MFLTVPPLVDRPGQADRHAGQRRRHDRRARSASTTRTCHIDGVEIDPEVNAVAKQYFGSGRQPAPEHGHRRCPALPAAAEEKYDLIFIDAYRQPYVPFYLATADFFKLCRDRLTPDGIVALNVSTVPGDDRLSRAIAGTLATQFPLVMKWPALRFNQLVLGFAQHTDPAVLAERAARGPRGHPARSPTCSPGTGPRWPPMEDFWTDDRCPGGVDHRPHDHHVRRERQGPRGADAPDRPVTGPPRDRHRIRRRPHT